MTDDRLRHLYATYGPTIYERCRRLLRDDSLAEDAAQETFVRVARHLDRVPDAQRALAWIFRIATNHCLNVLRDRQRLELHATPERPGPEPEARLEDRDLLARLIARVPPKIRTTAWLYHVDGLDQEEVAKVLGVTRRTVINHLARFERSARKLAEMGRK